MLTASSACDDGGSSATGLDKFLPPLPTPDGTPQSVYAGQIAAASELLPGEARTALVGDFYIKNSRASFAIQGPARFIGVVPWGGNVIDAVPLDTSGNPAADDHLGEISLVYLLGRTCGHESVEVLLDGSGGGPAVIRARGKAQPNDFINLQGIGFFVVPGDQDPFYEDGVECATTFTLYPDSPVLEIAWTLYNGGTIRVSGPIGALNDTGGDVESFAPVVGFDRAGIEAILSPGDPVPIPYAIYQGPGVAYGVVPVHEPASTPNSTVLVAGVSLVLLGIESFVDILDSEKYFLTIEPKAGHTQRMQLVVGRQAADIDAVHRATVAETTVDVSGTVTWSPSGAGGEGARVGVYKDLDGDGELDDTDTVHTYFEAGAGGAFAGKVPAGSYLLRADVRHVARGPVVALDASAAQSGVAVELPDPAKVDFTVTDSATGDPIPVKLTIVGRHPVVPDRRVHDTYDMLPHVVQLVHSAYGTSVPAGAGDPADPTILLPPGGPYRVFATRGTEWSMASTLISPTPGQELTIELELTRVVDTSGYLATEFHQHAIGSPDSPVPYEKRLRTLAAEGIEFFASTDHDYVTDYDPIIDELGLRPFMDGVPGIEATPFAYGHFIAFPLEIAEGDPTQGAVDWARGPVSGFAMLPGDMWTELRSRGAKIVQVNHPRGSGFTGFQAYFDVAGLVFDFAAGTFGSDPGEQPVPIEWLHLENAAEIFDDKFDTLEVWNGFGPEDPDADGVPDMTRLDQVIRDWMNFLSFGKVVSPVGNSDTHTRDNDAAGLPRTMVRVPDDSSAGLAAGVEEDVYATLLGSSAPRDVVVTNGPMIAVTVGGQPAIGGTVAPAAPGGEVTFTITATSPDWIDFDTIEIFANSTFEERADADPTIQPLACFTARPMGEIGPNDKCGNAPLGGARNMNVQVQQGARSATVTFTLAAADVPKHMHASGDDAWVVVRVRGQKAVFPLLTNHLLNSANVDALVSGSPAEIDAALTDAGIPAMAFTGAILVDFDGGGWKAPLAP